MSVQKCRLWPLLQYEYSYIQAFTIYLLMIFIGSSTKGYGMANDKKAIVILVDYYMHYVATHEHSAIVLGAGESDPSGLHVA